MGDANLHPKLLRGHQQKGYPYPGLTFDVSQSTARKGPDYQWL
jgi:hypothetical protein